jgi:hypothetical protein
VTCRVPRSLMALSFVLVSEYLLPKFEGKPQLVDFMQVSAYGKVRSMASTPRGTQQDCLFGVRALDGMSTLPCLRGANPHSGASRFELADRRPLALACG